MTKIANHQKITLISATFGAVIVLVALIYRPYLEHRWMLWRSGMTHDEYRESLHFPEPIMLEVGVTVDSVYAGREPMILITPDALVYPTWNITKIPRSHVSEMHWTLDGDAIKPDWPLSDFKPKQESYVLHACGRSAMHKAGFSNGVSFWVVESFPEHLLTQPGQKMLITDDATATRILLDHNQE